MNQAFMNLELTQPLEPDQDRVRYRCPCGEETVVSRTTGGLCPRCDRSISPKTLQHELALTMTIGALDHDFTTSEAGGVRVADSPDEMIGKTLGHFEIVAPLGRGGMGQVYQALDKSLQRYVAVKVLRSGIGSSVQSTSSEAEIDNLLQEAVAQARVSHPHIVTIYYVGKQDGNPFLAMELVNGAPLSDVVTRKELSFAEIGSIAMQMAEALQFSHELDIVHGDIKPSNVLLQPNGRIKISDFGMARRASDENSGRVGGTPNYLAPEILNGQKPTIQSDMYALGVTLYELTFGRLPIALTGHTITDWIASHDRAEITYPNPWPEHLPESWRNILKKLLASDPAQRYRDYDELLTELAAIQPASRVIARRVPRIMAAGIDYLTVLLCMLPFQIFLDSQSLLGGFLGNHPIVSFLVQIGHFIPIVAYTLLLMAFRQSLGRVLMHVRVVNRYGLKPAPRVMVARSLLRMSFIWAACCVVLLEDATWLWVQIGGASLIGLTALFLLVDTAVMMIYDQARSLHDLVFSTRVVLDTD